MTAMVNEEVRYHVFANNCDEWFDTYAEALALYKEWTQEYGSARLYKEVYIDEELDVENCLEAAGAYPW